LLDLAADRLLAALDRLLAPDIEPHGAVELERLATRGRLPVAVDDADLLARLLTEANTEKTQWFGWFRPPRGGAHKAAVA
jgi:hypothetical protein